MKFGVAHNRCGQGYSSVLSRWSNCGLPVEPNERTGNRFESLPKDTQRSSLTNLHGARHARLCGIGQAASTWRMGGVAGAQRRLGNRHAIGRRRIKELYILDLRLLEATRGIDAHKSQAVAARVSNQDVLRFRI